MSENQRSRSESRPGLGPERQQPGAAGRPALHAPWRQTYIESLGETDSAGQGAGPGAGSGAGPGAGPGPGDASFLETYWKHPELDARHHVIGRTDLGMVLLNRFPYAGGHLLVALGSPRPRLLDYDARERRHLWELVDRAAEALESALRPQGINIGVNQGLAAGAGVPSHLHVHLVPRWSGDVNFMSVVGEIRVIPNTLESMADRIRSAWASAADPGR